MYCDSTTVRYGVIHGHTPTDWIVQLCMFPYNHLSTGAFPTSAHVNLLMSWWAMRLPMRHWVSIQNGSTAPVAFSSRESPFRMNKLKTFEHRTVYIYIYYVYIYIYIWRDSKCNHHLEPFEHCRQQGWSSRKPTLIQPSRWYFPYLPILLFSRRFLGPTGEMFPEPRISAVLGDFELYSLPPLVPSLFDWRQYHVGTALKPREILRPCHASVTRLQAPLALTN